MPEHGASTEEPQSRYKIRSGIAFRETGQGPGLKQKDMTVIRRLRPEETIRVSTSWGKVSHKEVAVLTEKALVPKRAKVENVRLWGRGRVSLGGSGW